MPGIPQEQRDLNERDGRDIQIAADEVIAAEIENEERHGGRRVLANEEMAERAARMRNDEIDEEVMQWISNMVQEYGLDPYEEHDWVNHRYSIERIKAWRQNHADRSFLDEEKYDEDAYGYELAEIHAMTEMDFEHPLRRLIYVSAWLLFNYISGLDRHERYQRFVQLKQERGEDVYEIDLMDFITDEPVKAALSYLLEQHWQESVETYLGLKLGFICRKCMIDLQLREADAMGGINGEVANINAACRVILTNVW